MKNYNKSGFTLIELAIVISILSIITIPMIGIFGVLQKTSKAKETKKKLEVISNAFAEYYAGNIDDGSIALLPCPADITAANARVANCSVYTINSGTIYYGAVPTETLKISSKYQIDGWGNKISYYVTQIVTSTSNEIGNIDVRDHNLNETTALVSDVSFVLISHGADGAGAYNNTGNQAPLADDIFEQNNSYVHNKSNSQASPFHISAGAVGDIAISARKNDIISNFVTRDANNNYVSGFTIKRDTGNVGIGSISPANTLHIVSSNNKGVTIQNNDNSNTTLNKKSHILFKGVDSQNTEKEIGKIEYSSEDYNHTHDRLSILVRGGDALAEKLTILGQSGNVGIGKTDPEYKLDVDGDIRASSNLISNSLTANTHNHSSDLRLKKKIRNLTNSLDKISKLRGVSFLWRKDQFPDRNFSNQEYIGLIAQEIEEYFPQLVTTDNKGYKNIAYANLIAPLIEGVKTLNHNQKKQQAEINNLQNLLHKNKPNIVVTNHNKLASKVDFLYKIIYFLISLNVIFIAILYRKKQF